LGAGAESAQAQVRLSAVLPEVQVFHSDGSKRLADLHMLTFISSGTGPEIGIRAKFSADDVRCTNFPFVVTNGDVLEHRLPR